MEYEKIIGEIARGTINPANWAMVAVFVFIAVLLKKWQRAKQMILSYSI